MIRFSQKSLILIFCLLMINFNKMVNAQSRCATACQNNPQCSSGVCTLASCSDTTSCYQFCLNCNSVITCYGSGNGCSFTNALVQISSSASLPYLKYNFIYALTIFTLVKFLK